LPKNGSMTESQLFEHNPREQEERMDAAQF
jgi:hypothetical protein